MDLYNASGRRVAALLFGIALLALVFVAPVLYGQAQPFKVLVYSEIPASQTYHRDSIPAGVTAIQQLGQQNNFTVATAINLNWTPGSPSVFPKDQLSQYDVIVFLSPNGNNILAPADELALQNYISSGKGFVAVHGAVSFERDWGWYRQLLGAHIGRHDAGPNAVEPPIGKATVNVLTTNHPATNTLPSSWERTDEWYNLRYNAIVVDGTPVPAITVTTTPLIKVDEATYEGEGIGAMGDPHPVSWYHNFAGGRSFVTTMGHFANSYGESDPLFRQHILGGIVWAAGRGAAPSPLPSSSASPSASAAPSAGPSAAPSPSASASPSAAPLPGGINARHIFVPLVQE